jgi:hypothetical protein
MTKPKSQSYTKSIVNVLLETKATPQHTSRVQEWRQHTWINVCCSNIINHAVFFLRTINHVVGERGRELFFKDLLLERVDDETQRSPNTGLIKQNKTPRLFGDRGAVTTHHRVQMHRRTSVDATNQATPWPHPSVYYDTPLHLWSFNTVGIF